MLTAKEIRKSFTDFFASKGHTIVPSAPMVVKNDPTLMFTNAGMNQFKDIFLGNTPRKYPRVANSQKCLRVSGKHNDLEEVGHDTYHHTMFEMLGNWSFGDYFKKEAISWAWEYLVDVLKIDPNRLYATVFEGSKEDGLSRDEEAAEIWAQFLPKERIINGNKHDNFWEMGDTGPCGPCSEIHIDLRSDEERKKVDGLTLVNHDHPQVIEIWNNVFMQYNRKADGSLEPLPAKHVDTGMGFERLCMALQGKQSNYDTDVFQPIIKEIGKICGCEYGKSKETDIAMRVVADHIRTISFSITDGQLPSNAKAGYVIRRILRRAVRYGYTFLGQKQAFLYKLLPALIDSMGDAYPELKAQQELVVKVIKEEEDSFLRTLETGIRLLDKVMAETKAAGKSQISGVDGFTLYDTFGFPLDLTELILRENGMTINEEEFNVEMQKQKERARNAASVETGDWVTLKEGESKFIGYDFFEADIDVLRYRKIKQKNTELFQVVFDKTPFYAEMGGQMGDSGYIEADGVKYEVLDTKKENNLTVHLMKKLPSDLTSSFHAVIDLKKRQQTACNHTATHLLDYALRQVLGTHVEQKGSLVSADSLRFDFSHFQKVTDEELRKAEKLANELVRQNIPLEEFRDLPIDKAREMGAIALFGEKYGDTVRMIKYGPSMELCGGTHVKATGEIGMIRIISESSVAAGVRRIEAISAEKVEESMDDLQDMVRDLKNIFNNTPNLVQAIKKAMDENAELKKAVEAHQQEKVAKMKDELIAKAENKGGVKLITLQGSYTPDMVKSIAFQIRNTVKEDMAFVAATSVEGKPTLTIALSDTLVAAGNNATQMVRDAAKLIQGGGGGQPFFAQAGGKNAGGLSEAFELLCGKIGK
ncbi:MAG: alanine--tRNA ligase [Paludibacteraceae bacterium]|nr:alanine--tRNA ligase [Paludibacteraceae bacterium]MBR4840322.1 alanine--tRNA ligase [Paludibacteraceae bacterium]